MRRPSDHLPLHRPVVAGVGALLLAAACGGCGASSSHPSAVAPTTTSPAARAAGGTGGSATSAAPVATSGPGAPPGTTPGAAGSGTAGTTPGATPGSNAATPATSPPLPATTTLPAGPRPCTTAQLRLGLGTPNGAAGSTYITLTMTNVGTATCTLDGYPGVSYVAGDTGTQVGAPAARDTTTPVSGISVGAGHAAHSLLRLIDPYDFDPPVCRITAVRGFRVYPPGQVTAGFVSDPGKACASPSLPEPALYVGPAQAGG